MKSAGFAEFMRRLKLLGPYLTMGKPNIVPPPAAQGPRYVIIHSLVLTDDHLIVTWDPRGHFADFYNIIHDYNLRLYNNFFGPTN